MPDSRLLLVHAGAFDLAEAMARAVANVEVVPAETLMAAKAHLVGTSFDLILAQAVLPDGPAVSLSELDIAVPPLVVRTDSPQRRDEAVRAGAAYAFVAEAEPVVLASVAAWHLDARPAPDLPSPSNARHEPRLQPIADELARLTHAINNPLAVVVGNAQLVRELFAMAPEDDMIPGSLADIETAARELVALIDEVQALRRQIDEHIGGA